MSGAFPPKYATTRHPLFVPQTTYWDCGLAALRASFKAYYKTQKDLSHRGWRRLMNTIGVRWNDYGLPIPAVAEIAAVLDMKPHLILGPEYKPGITNKNRIDLQALKKRHDIALTEFRRSFQSARATHVKTTFYKKQNTVIKALQQSLQKCPALIMEVHCQDAYGIDYEDWTHYLAIIKKRNTWIWIDPYLRMGEKDFGTEEWKQCLKQAKTFTLKNWKGGFIAFNQ